MALAWRFGVSGEVDAYLFVINLVNWSVLVWFSVLTVVLIPLEARLRRQSPRELRPFRRQLLGFAIAVGIALVALGELAMPRLLTSSVLGMPVATVQRAQLMAPTLAWIALPGILAGLFSAWLMSSGRNINTLCEGVPARVLFCALIVGKGTEVLVVGTVLGVVLQLLCLVWLSIRADGLVAPQLGFNSEAWGLFVRGFGLMLAGQLILGVTTLVDQFFAARLGVGAISSLGYASRLLTLLTGLATVAVTRATLPVLSRTAGDSRARRIAFHWAGLLALAGLILMAMGWLLAPWAVRLLYEHGTFSSGDTTVVTTLLRFGLLQLPFYFAALPLVSLHSSRGAYGILMLCCASGLVVKLAALWVLFDRFGVRALLISAAVMYLANLLLMMAVGAGSGARRALCMPGR